MSLIDLAALRTLVREECAAALREARAQVASPAGYLTTRQAAQLAACAPQTIRSWVKAKRLRAFHAGRDLRVARADLDAFLRTEPEAGDLTPEAAAMRYHRGRAADPERASKA